MLKRFFLCCCASFLMCMAHVTFTNLKCSYKNSEIGSFRHCHIKAVNRTHKYISIYSNIYHKPLDNVTLNLKVMRNDNGYKPFFFDATIDACRFLKTQRHPIIIMFYNTFKARSNLNHTCPYNHDVIIDRLYSGDHETEFARYLPIPLGDYAIYITFYVEKVEACNVNLYLRVTK